LGRNKTELAHEWEGYLERSESEHYIINETGISHPIIITELNGVVNIGDELAAYADGELVGAVKITDMDQTLVLSAWGGYSEYGFDLKGYEVGDAIELRLWSASESRELDVDMELSDYFYGETPLTTGSITAFARDAVPGKFEISQIYPNPFNPVTTIEYSLNINSVVTLSIFNTNGQLMEELTNGYQEAGWHAISWNANNQPSGLYFVKIQVGEEAHVNKLMLLK
jgi:hypothetical protein